MQRFDSVDDAAVVDFTLPALTVDFLTDPNSVILLLRAFQGIPAAYAVLLNGDAATLRVCIVLIDHSDNPAHRVIMPAFRLEHLHGGEHAGENQSRQKTRREFCPGLYWDNPLYIMYRTCKILSRSQNFS